MTERILFADLDGTIIDTKSGNIFPTDCNDWKLKEGIVEAIKSYKPSHLFIVSNQGGIEKGFVDEFDFQAKLFDIEYALHEYLPDVIIDYSYEISNDKDNPRRKPNTGMLEAFCRDYFNNYDLAKKNAMMIGDASGKEGQFSDSDKKTAENFGIEYMDINDFIS